MKMRCLLGLSMGVLMSGSVSWGGDLPWEMQLPFKEATIHYQLRGNEQGEEILYIKDYGRQQAKYHKGTSAMMGMTIKTETVQLTDPDWIFTYDLVEKTGTKTTNPNKIYREEYTKLNRDEKQNFEKNAKKLGVAMMAQFGGTVSQAKDKFLGYDCDVVSVSGISTTYLLQGTGVPLKTEMSMMGMKNSIVATQVDTASTVPAKMFTPPVGIAAEIDPQAEAMTKSTVQQMVNSLKTPDGATKMLPQQPGAGVKMDSVRQQAMGMDGVSAEEQAEMMRRMQEAMQQMQQQQ